MLERAGHGLVLLKWVGRNNNDSQVVQVKSYIDRFWTRHNYQTRGNWQTSSRGENQCTVDGLQGSAPDDCFSHFALDYNEAGHNECTEYGCGYFCEQWAVDYGYYGCTVVGECAPEYANTCLASTWVVDYLYDDMDIFAFLTVTEGLQAAGVTSGFPTTDPVDYKTRYLTLLIDNQMSDGGWDDSGWVQGSPFGAAWATIILSKF